MMATFHGSYKEESTLRNQSRCGFNEDVAHDQKEALGLPPLIGVTYPNNNGERIVGNSPG